MFRFTREHFKQCVDHPLFIEGHKLAFLHIFTTRNPYCGDMDINVSAEAIKSLNEFRPYSDEWLEKAYELFGHLPLHKIYPWPDPKRVILEDDEQYTETSKAIALASIHFDIAKKATDRYDPCWYIVPNSTAILNQFIVYPMLRILFPKMEIRFWKGNGNSGLSNCNWFPGEGVESNIDGPRLFNLGWQHADKPYGISYADSDGYIKEKDYIKSLSNSSMKVQHLNFLNKVHALMPTEPERFRCEMHI